MASVVSGCGGSPTSPGGSSTPLGVVAGQFISNRVDVTVAGSPLATIGGAALVESVAGMFLVSRSSETAFTAIDAICSHQSCTVTGADGDHYVCPCHGSRYDRSGRVTQGPATASLRRFNSSFTNGVLTISL